MSLDLEPDSFWSKTPRELNTIFAGKWDGLVRDHNSRAGFAYFTAYAPRGKQRIPLRKLLIRDRTPQSPEKMQAVAKQWTLFVGGEIKGKPN